MNKNRNNESRIGACVSCGEYPVEVVYGFCFTCRQKIAKRVEELSEKEGGKNVV